MNRVGARASRKRRRMTRQRRAILEALRGSRAHPTAEGIHRLVRGSLPRISLGTVYRNLDVLCGAGQALRLECAGGRRRFDGTTAPHYHVRCRSCGAVADVAVEAPAGLEAAARRACRYEILGYRLEFVGLCRRCRRRK